MPPEVQPRTSMALVRGQAVQAHRLFLVFGDTFTVGVYLSDLVLQKGVALLGSLPEPARGFGIILGDAVAELIHVPEEELRTNAALLGRTPEPAHRFGIIFGDAAPGMVPPSEVELGLGVTLLGRAPESVEILLCQEARDTEDDCHDHGLFRIDATRV